MRVSWILFCLRRLAVLLTILYFAFKIESTTDVIKALQKNTQTSTTATKPIVLVIVVCPLTGDSTPRDEAVVLLKSIIISAKLNNILTIEVHLFVENVSQEEIYFRNKIKEFGYPFMEFVLILHFHSAVNAVPPMYRNEFIFKADYSKLMRCTNVRLFISSALPRVDAVIYFDTDIVVHGNLAELWNTWNLLNSEQLNGIGSNYEEGSELAERFKDDLYPPPRFLNPGVILMNLTRMRSFGWERKVLRMWNQYKNKIRNINDQDVINIFLYFNQNLLFRLPCHHNFMDQHCTPNAPCNTAKSTNLQVIHGAGGYFGRPNAIRNIYLTYQEMNIYNLNFNSNEKFRAFVHKSFNYFSYTESICHDILSDIIK